MVRIFGTVILVLMILLFPPTALALISNNAVPGDVMYPVKRGLERGILAVVSINPNTKALFTVERSNRRFTEAIVLISSSKNEEAADTLDELVKYTKDAAKDVKSVPGRTEKKQLIKKLRDQIKKYDNELEKIENELVAQPEPTSVPGQPYTSPYPTPSETIPTPTTFIPRPTSGLVPSPTSRPLVFPSVPSPRPTLRPSPTNVPARFIAPPVNVAPIRNELEIIDNELEQEDEEAENITEGIASLPTIPPQADQEPAIPSPTPEPTVEPTPNLQFIIPTGSFQKNSTISPLPTPTSNPEVIIQNVPPSASVTGPTNGSVFKATVFDNNADLSRGQLWVIKADGTLPSNCPSGIIAGASCLIVESYLSGSLESFSGFWSTTEVGTYLIFVQAFDSKGLKCSSAFENLGSDWSDCGSNDFLIFNVN